ncbi:FAD-binding protein [Chloroflexota bacterium]
MMTLKTIETEVLVIGGGGAAARAALEAHQAGAKVTLVVKGDFGLMGCRGSGATACGCRNSFNYFRRSETSVNPTDEDEAIFKRIIQAGLGMTDKHLVRVVMDNVVEAGSALKKWGVMLGLPGSEIFSSEGPTVIVPMPALACVVRSYSEITVRDRMMIVDLLIQDGKCVGAIGIDESSGELFLFKAASTILATGGNSQLFMLNFHPSCVTGDGYAMGYEAGAELMNMEFQQMFTSIIYSIINSPRPDIAWGLYPKVRNVNGDEFIQSYLPQGVTLEECMEQKALHNPFSTRDASKCIEIALVKEATAGRANEHNAFYLDTTDPKIIPPRRQRWIDYLGRDYWSKENIEISVLHHCSNGGLRIDENGQTTIPGLYAIGETAAGAYGADRLGGNMQASCHVFGVKAGKHAAAIAKSNSLPPVDDQIAENRLQRIAALKKSRGDQKPFELTKILKKTAWENLMLVRSKEGLIHFLSEVERIRGILIPRLHIESTAELVEVLELENLLKVGEIMANVALMRTESRGSHHRDDFPDRDDANWLQSIVVKKEAGEMQLSTRILDGDWEDKPGDLVEGVRWG